MPQRLDTLTYLRRFAIPTAFALLPEEWSNDRAVAMLLTIAQQETRARYRTQLGRGPARSFYQFELGTVDLLLKHHDTREPLETVCRVLSYPPYASLVHEAMQHQDVLASAFARALLWTLPEALPGPHDAEDGWFQYIRAWNPGKPHRDSWDAFYAVAWDMQPDPTLRRA